MNAGPRALANARGVLAPTGGAAQKAASGSPFPTTVAKLLFGEGNSTQNFYSLSTSRKQKFEEDLAFSGANIERLSRLAYPECPYSVRDKIVCA